MGDIETQYIGEKTVLRAVFIFITGAHNFPFQPVRGSSICPIIRQGVDFQAHKFSIFSVKTE